LGEITMPKMFVHSPQGTFTAEARVRVASALTDLGLECEHLADTERVRAGIWVFFTEHAPDAVFRSGAVAPGPIMSLFVYTLKGGLDDASTQRLIAEATAILGKYAAGISGDQVPLYVGIQEIPEERWGMYGKHVSLAALR
jgi:phenylpyruvate tautomerase PptA (4-oxalocrotonate tautomerase family)